MSIFTPDYDPNRLYGLRSFEDRIMAPYRGHLKLGMVPSETPLVFDEPWEELPPTSAGSAVAKSAPPNEKEKAKAEDKKDEPVHVCYLVSMTITKKYPGDSRQILNIDQKSTSGSIDLLAPISGEYENFLTQLDIQIDNSCSSCEKSTHPKLAIEEKNKDKKFTYRKAKLGKQVNTSKLPLASDDYIKNGKLANMPEAQTKARWIMKLLGPYWTEKIEPRTYTIKSESCGLPDPNDTTQKPEKNLDATINVYPDDRFCFELKTPALFKVSAKLEDEGSADKAKEKAEEGAKKPLKPQGLLVLDAKEFDSNLTGEHTIEADDKEINIKASTQLEKYVAPASIIPKFTRNGIKEPCRISYLLHLYGYFFKVAACIGSFIANFQNIIPTNLASVEGSVGIMEGTTRWRWGWKETDTGKATFGYHCHYNLSVIKAEVKTFFGIKIDKITKGLNSLADTLEGIATDDPELFQTKAWVELRKIAGSIQTVIGISADIAGRIPLENSKDEDNPFALENPTGQERAKNHAPLKEPVDSKTDEEPDEYIIDSSQNKIKLKKGEKYHFRDVLIFTLRCELEVGKQYGLAVRLYNKTPIDVAFTPGEKWLGLYRPSIQVLYDSVAVFGEYEWCGTKFYFGEGNDELNAWLKTEARLKKKLDSSTGSKSKRKGKRPTKSSVSDNATQELANHQATTKPNAAPLFTLINGNKDLVDAPPPPNSFMSNVGKTISGTIGVAKNIWRRFAKHA